MTEKKYVIDNAKMMVEWDWDKNNSEGNDPKKITIGSHKYAYWICEIHNVRFKQEIRARAKGERGCLQCFDEWKNSISRERYIKGKAVLADTHPDLLLEWISSDNPKFTPYTCVAGSNVKVKWKCRKCGGEYESYICNRALRGSGCPYCSNQKVLVGYNDLQSKLPDLAIEWSKKNNIKPTEITEYSSKKVYWVCPLGHDDYLMSVKQRSNRQGCPICAKQSQTSFPEQVILYYLKQKYPDAVNRYKYNGREIDVFIPSRNIGIEYNGYYSHKNKKDKDSIKKKYFESVGISLFIVEEYKCYEEKKQADFYIHERTSFDDLNTLVKEIFKTLEVNEEIDVNCARDAIAIKNQYIALRKDNSIASVRPDLISRWDYDKNGTITPDMVSLGTGQRFYWKCKLCNKSYLALPSRIAQGSVCAKHHVILKKDINDLATKYPELLKYWDYDKNEVKPNEVYAGGESVIYWVCEKGHSYSKVLRKRIAGEGCPICSGKKVLEGVNDLSTIYPDVAKFWNYEKNGEVYPTQVTAHSNKKMWWKCDLGHEWQAKVCNRVNGRGCPECYRVKKGKRKINMYDAKSLTFIDSFESVKDVCEYLGLDYEKASGTISNVCRRKQKTLMKKYILRDENDDEFLKG